MSDTYTHDQLYKRSILEALFINDEKKIAEERLEGFKQTLKSDLQDFVKYEKELKNRKGKKRHFEDREIDPRLIEARRNEARQMIENEIVSKNYFKGLLSEKKPSTKEKLKIKKKPSSD